MRMKRAQRMIKGPSLAWGTKTMYSAKPTMSSTNANIRKPRITNAEGKDLIAVLSEVLGLGIISLFRPYREEVL